MKVKEQARKDLAEILLRAESLLPDQRNRYVIGCMVECGWEIDTGNLASTARDLGFPVIGNCIYGLDE